MIAVDEPSRRRIDLRDLFGDCGDGFIHNGVLRRPNDFEFGNAAVFLDANFDQRREFRIGWDVRGRLNPGAVKTVVQHVAVPAEFRRAGSAGHLAALAR